MKSNLKITSIIIYSLISFTVVSCGSTKDGTSYADYDGIYDDLSYNPPKEESKKPEPKIVEQSTNPFLFEYDQVMEYDATEFLFTDIESYASPYEDDLTSIDSLSISYSGEAPWAYNDNKVEVNVYNNGFNSPFYGGRVGMNFYVGGFAYPPPFYGWNGYPYYGWGWNGYPYYGWGWNGYPYYHRPYRPYPGYRPGRAPYYYGKRGNRISYQGRYNSRRARYAYNSPSSRGKRVNASNRSKYYQSGSKSARTRTYTRNGKNTYSKSRGQSARKKSYSSSRRSSNNSYQSGNRSKTRSYNNSGSRNYGNRSSSRTMTRSSGFSRSGGSSSRGSSGGRRSGGGRNQ